MTDDNRPAADRWHALVTARLEEADELQDGAGDLGPEFWDRRAEDFAAAVADTAGSDPFLAHVSRHVGPDSVIADVGAGSGRFTLALAPRVAAVVAIDQSPRMLELIDRAVAEQDLDNVTTRPGEWPDVENVAADVVICSYVIPMIPDLGRFLSALDAAAGRGVHISMNAATRDLVDDHLWRHFHGRRRSPSPTYLDAAAVAEELRLDPSVRVLEHESMSRWDDLDDAVGSYRRRLLLEDGPAVRDELARLLADWLVKRDGALRIPFRTFPMAIISWAGSTRGTPR